MDGSAAYQIGPGTFVRLAYTLYDAEGEPVEQPAGPRELTMVFGYGQLLPALERSIEGMRAGGQASVTLKPKEAFGRRRPEAVIEVDRSDFPPDVAPGDRFEAESDAGELVVLSVLEVGEDVIQLDTNHPLAGQTIRVDLEVLDVRPANDEELAGAAERLESRYQSPTGELVPLERLLRGGSRG